MAEGSTRSRIEALVDNHRAFLAFLERRVGDRATAEDLLQEAFARSLDKVEDVRSDESVQAWFYRVLRNAVIDHHRRSGAAACGAEALAAELAGRVEPPPGIAREICSCLGRVADALPPAYAEAIRRVDLQGMAVREWAAAAGITPNNAAVRLHRARAALRRELVASCGTCATHGCLDCGCAR